MVDQQTVPSEAQLVNTPRRRRIVDGLRFLGGGPEEFYIDALRILASPQNLTTASHLVAHCLREVESAIREALLPIGYEPDMREGEHKRQVTAVLTELGITPDDPLAKLWLTVAGEKVLPRRAHRRNLMPARELDSDALVFIDRLETLFDGILTVSESRYTALLPRLEKLASKPQPTRADLAFVKQRMPRNPVTLGHFFGALHSPNWLRPLAKRGMFRIPPGLGPQNDGRVLVPQWIEGRYLAEMASFEPQVVLGILKGLPTIANPRVYEGVADIALALPAGVATELVPMLKVGLTLPAQLLLPQTTTDVVIHLADGGRASDALELSRQLFRILPPPADGSAQLGLYGARSVMNEWEYGQAISKVRRSLVAADPLGSLRLFADLLDAAVQQSRPASAHADRDYSEMWRDEISSEQDEHMDIANILVSALAQTAQDLVTAHPTTAREVAAELDAPKFPVFRRILLEVTRHLADPSLATELLLRNDLFEKWSPEYQKLLRQEFPSISEAFQDEVLGWVEAGPASERVEAFLRGPGRRAPSLDEMSNWTDGWRRHRLEVIGHPLPTSWMERLGYLAAAQPAPELVFGPRHLVATGIVGSKEPVDLSHMDREALVAYLNTLGSADPWSGRGTTDVSTAIRQQVGADPAWPGELNDDFAGVSRTMIEAIVGGYGVAFDLGGALPWGQVMKSFLWVIGRSVTAPDGEAAQGRDTWDFTLKSILWLLEKGFKKSEQSIPIEERYQVWAIIKAIDDGEATSADEAAWALDDTAGVASLNTVAGAIVSTAIEYGAWADQQSRGIDGMSSLPELRALLDSRLAAGADRAPVVGEVFGRYLPILWRLDSEWTRVSLGQIFNASRAGTTAWHTFLVFWGASPWIFPHIRHLYEGSLQEFPRSEVPERKSDDWARDLAEHLIVYRAWAGVEHHDGDLLDTFFDVAPADLRRHALEFPGFLLSRKSGEPPPDGTIERLMSVWERRATYCAAASSTDGSQEMRAFGYWFTSQAFPLEWSVRELVRALELGGQIENEHGVVALLATLDDDYLGQAVRALTLMSSTDDEGWRILGWGNDGHTILERGRNSVDEPVRAAATLLVSRLLRRGYDTFKDLADQA